MPVNDPHLFIEVLLCQKHIKIVGHLHLALGLGKGITESFIIVSYDAVVHERFGKFI